jgi:hypothetical protein
MMIVAGLLAVVPFVLMRQSPEARAANRIRAAYYKAQEPLFRVGANELDANRFAVDLKAIDLEGAPADVEAAMIRMIAAVDHANETRWKNGDTNAANEWVATGKRDLLRALDRWRGQPF